MTSTNYGAFPSRGGGRTKQTDIPNYRDTTNTWSANGAQSLDLAQSMIYSEDEPARTLGTVKGVFAPVCLSMFSALLFLRLGYIVGNAGFLHTVLLFLIAYTILVSTVCSICAIASNGAVKTGGVYFMLSRTLGLESGGGVGVLFYFANVAGSALYVTACVEGLLNCIGVGEIPLEATARSGLPVGKWWNILYATTINIANLCFCLVGAKLFGKLVLSLLLLVGLCCLAVILSYFLDHSYNFSYSVQNITVQGSFQGIFLSNITDISKLWTSNLYPKYQQDCQDSEAEVSFSRVFAVLFSGVTGIMSGANLSGDLVTPSRSIPTGTLSACLLTLLTFLLLSILTSLTCDPVFLQNDCMFMAQFTFWSPLVLVGALLATWSASLSNMIGGSRVLQALAEDTMFGPFLSFINRGTVENNPITAVILTFGLVEAVFFMGGLNQIAQFCSVLFLLSYSSVNLACLGLDLASAPNFRPSFSYFSWQTSLIGLVGSATMMFFISPLFAAVSILLCLSLIISLHFFSPTDNIEGSISQALIFHQVRKYLLMLDPRKSHTKFWRPQMLLLVHNPRSCCSLIDFVNSMKKGGLYVLGQVTIGSLANSKDDALASKADEWLMLVDHLRVKAFVELTLASSVRIGVEQLMRVSGIGAMKPNTVLLGFYDDTVHRDDLENHESPFFSSAFEHLLYKDNYNNHDKFGPEEYIGIIEDSLKLEKNQTLDREEVFNSKHKIRMGAGRKKYLDVWPINFFTSVKTDIEDNTSLFLLQLACIVNMVPKWRKHRIRVFLLSPGESGAAGREREVLRLLDVLRVRAETVLLDWNKFPEENMKDNLSVANDLMRSQCDETAVSFIYMPRPPQLSTEHSLFLQQLELLTRDLPPTILVSGVRKVTY